jgi:hypothetical protein
VWGDGGSDLPFVLEAYLSGHQERPGELESRVMGGVLGVGRLRKAPSWNFQDQAIGERE